MSSGAMSVQEVATYLNVDERTIYRLVKGKGLPGFKVAGTWRFRREDLDTWIEARRADAHGAPPSERDAEARLRLAIEGSPVTVYENDLSLRYTWISNPRFGLSADEILGKRDDEILPPDQVEDLIAFKQRVLETGRDLRHRFSPTIDGRVHAFDLLAEPIRVDGTISGIRVASVDVTPARDAREALRRSTETLRLAADAAEIGVFDLDHASGDAVWDERLRSIFGLPAGAPEEGTPLDSEQIHPDDRDEVRAKLALAFDPSGDGSFEHEYRIFTRNGEERCIFVKAKTHFPAEANEQVAARTVGTVLDVTEKRAAEKKLFETQDRLRRLFDEAPALIAVHEGPEHVYIYSNPAHDRAVGRRPLIGIPLRQAMPEIANTPIVANFDEVFRTGKPIETPVFEATFDRDGDGRIATGFYSQILQPWFGARSEVAGVMSFAFEITAEVALRRRAEESERKFRTLADNISQLAWMADGTGSIFWYNRRWFEYTGTTIEDVHGWGWKKVHHPAHVDRVVDKISRCFETGRVWEDIFPLRSSTGEYRWFLSRAEPIRDEKGNIIQWFGTNTDVSDQREAEERLREADRRKDEFLAMLGHELRNPLAAITSATEMMGEVGDDPSLFERLRGVLERQTTLMTKLVDGLLEVSRIARGKISLTRQPLDFRELVDHILIDRFGPTSEIGLQLVSNLPGNPVWVEGDYARLVQVVDNLIGNAIKFTGEPGEIFVTLEEQESVAVLSVRDTGIGISAEMLDEIFEPFQQGPQDLARTGGGLGLGLALSRGIAELHDGSLTAASTGVGEGAEFILRLSTVAPPQPRSIEESPSGVVIDSLRILLVEDNADAAMMLKELLTLRRHDVAVRASALEGLEFLEEDSVDLILCDLGLPGMSGYELARRIRAGRHADLPLIALTGYGQHEDRKRSADAGFDEHLVKPVDTAALDAVLSRLTARR